MCASCGLVGSVGSAITCLSPGTQQPFAEGCPGSRKPHVAQGLSSVMGRGRAARGHSSGLPHPAGTLPLQSVESDTVATGVEKPTYQMLSRPHCATLASIIEGECPSFLKAAAAESRLRLPRRSWEELEPWAVTCGRGEGSSTASQE